MLVQFYIHPFSIEGLPRSPETQAYVDEYYDDFEVLLKKLDAEKSSIQCVVSNENVVDFVKFGQTQHPKLWNYADNVDTIQFLLKLN